MKTNKNDVGIARHGRSLAYAGFVAVMLTVVPNANANWKISPELGVGLEYDDNVGSNNSSGSPSSDAGYSLSALATFFYDAELTDFKITPRIRSKAYRDNSDLDSTDQFLKFNLSHNRQKSNFRLLGDFSRESVRTAERADVDFDIDDPDEVPVDDSGRLFDTGKRERLRLSPEFDYRLSRRVLWQVGGELLDTSYDSDVSLRLAEFRHYSIGTSLRYSWTERDTVSLNAYVGKFELDRASTDSSSSAFGIGYNRKLSERTRLRMLVASDNSEDLNGIDRSNPIGEVSIIHRYLTTRVIASYRRTTSGSGSNGLAVRDTFSLNVSRDLSPKLTLSGGVRAFTTEALDSSEASFVETDYLQIRALARWNMSRTMSFVLDYSYSENDRSDAAFSDVNNDSNRLALRFNWHPNPLNR